MAKEFDLVVIGAGPGGYVAAVRAAQEGLHVAVIENREVGGTCLNRGCVPTKTLLHASHLYSELTKADELGITVTGKAFDIKTMYSRKDKVVEQLRSGVEQLLQGNQIALIRGRAKIAGGGKVLVEGEEITAKFILVATGAAPARPPIPGLDLPGVITSDELLDQKGTAYQSLVIIGGGVIGMEFASVFQALGCAVTVIEAMDRILPTMDREVSQNLSMILKRRGVAIHTKSAVEHIVQDGEKLRCVFTGKGQEQSVTAQAVLVATGRKANIDGLFQEGAKVEFDRGIVVDKDYRTSLPGVYAIGDVTAGCIQLAHVASAQGCNAVMHMVGKKPEFDLSAVPACIYTDPEIASVGLTEAGAKAQGIPVKSGKYAMSGNAKSVIERQERGFIKLVFHKETGVILGAHLMCARATDLISELANAVTNGQTVEQVTGVIRPHPTFCEGISEAAESVLGKAVHILPRN